MRKQGLAGHSNTREIIKKSNKLNCWLILFPSYVRLYGLIQLATIAIENALVYEGSGKTKSSERALNGYYC